MNRCSFLHKAAATSALSSVGFKSNYVPVGSDIKITDVKVYQYEDGKDKAVFVKIETDEGTSGWGECSPNFSPVI